MGVWSFVLAVVVIFSGIAALYVAASFSDWR